MLSPVLLRQRNLVVAIHVGPEPRGRPDLATEEDRAAEQCGEAVAGALHFRCSSTWHSSVDRGSGAVPPMLPHGAAPQARLGSKGHEAVAAGQMETEDAIGALRKTSSQSRVRTASI